MKKRDQAKKQRLGNIVNFLGWNFPQGWPPPFESTACEFWVSPSCDAHSATKFVGQRLRPRSHTDRRRRMGMDLDSIRQLQRMSSTCVWVNVQYGSRAYAFQNL